MPTVKSQRQAIEDAIYNKLVSVAGVENVYREYQIARDMDEFLAKFREADQDRFQTWTIRRVDTASDTAQTSNDVANRCGLKWTFAFTVEMWYGYKKAETEAEMQNLIDDVLEAFKNQRTLGGWGTDRPLQLSQPLSATYLFHLYAHYAKFEVDVVTREEDIDPV